MLGTYALSAGYYDAYYGKAQKVRTLIIRDFDAAYERFDVLLSPTSPTTAFALGAKADPLAMYLNDVCTIPSNLAGHPAMSVPFGVGDDGLPVGVQVLAPALDEVTMFRVAAALEGAAGMSEHDAARRLGDGDRARGPLRAGHRDQAVLRVPQPASATSPTPTSAPPASACPARCRCSTSAAVELAMRLGRALALRREAVGVRPEELLLPGHAEGLPGLPVRPADQRATACLELPVGPAGRHRAGPHRGGHRQAHPRRRRRAHPRRRPLPRRLQPRRRAAGGDRVRARHAHRRAGPGVRRASCGRSSSPPA